MMTWREGFNYWRAWAKRSGDPDHDDLAAMNDFFRAMGHHCVVDDGELDDPIPEDLATRIFKQESTP
jgi:hypothetical protein